MSPIYMELAMVELRQLKKWLQKLLHQFLSEGARFTPFYPHLFSFVDYYLLFENPYKFLTQITIHN